MKANKDVSTRPSHLVHMTKITEAAEKDAIFLEERGDEKSERKHFISFAKVRRNQHPFGVAHAGSAIDNTDLSQEDDCLQQELPSLRSCQSDLMSIKDDLSCALDLEIQPNF